MYWGRDKERTSHKLIVSLGGKPGMSGWAHRMEPEQKGKLKITFERQAVHHYNATLQYLSLNGYP